MLVSVFGPRDFALTAPVCEHIDDHAGYGQRAGS
ncbi:hypothetical protein [Enterobacter hormaechei]